MERVYKLREWLTVPEAAEHLSRMLSETVSCADLLHLALDGHLRLSVHFVNGAYMRLGGVVPCSEGELRLLPNLSKKKDELIAMAELAAGFPKHNRNAQNDWLELHREALATSGLVPCLKGDIFPDSENVMLLQPEIVIDYGVWDLSMLGSERLDVQHALQSALDGPEVTVTSLNGPVVVSRDGATYAQVLEHMSQNEYADKGKKYSWSDLTNYYPAGGLPRDAALVVRTAALADFVASLEAPKQRDVDTRERVSLLAMIRALSVMAKAEGRGATASIERQLQELGFDSPKERTIREFLKEACELQP